MAGSASLQEISREGEGKDRLGKSGSTTLHEPKGKKRNNREEKERGGNHTKDRARRMAFYLKKRRPPQFRAGAQDCNTNRGN